VRFNPDAALETLPALLSDPADRKKLFKLVDAIIEDMRAAGQEPTQEQYAAWEKVQKVLGRSKHTGSK